MNKFAISLDELSIEIFNYGWDSISPSAHHVVVEAVDKVDAVSQITTDISLLISALVYESDEHGVKK